MTRALATALAAVLALSSGSGAQTPVMEIVGPTSNPITDAMPTFTLHARGFPAIDLPIQMRLQVSTTPDFEGALFADTTVNDTLAVVTIPRLLPSSGQLYWRALALTARAGSVPTQIVGPRTTPTHLRLVSPNNPAGQSLDTKQPTFVWRASRVPEGFGRWDYELRIEQTATGLPVLIARTTDTTLTVGTDLESNASYRWRVSALLTSTGDRVEAASAASFVIRSSDAPVATLLYHPFPNPFPNASSSRACIWFDLRVGGNITLDILDLNGHRVRRLVPGPQATNPFAPGRYGRPPTGGNGCEERFTWDGTDDRGRLVNPGIYIIRLGAEGSAYYERTAFQGR